MALEAPSPEDYARELLRALNLERVKEPAEVLAPLRLTMVERRTSGFDGALVCRKDRTKGIVLVRETIREPGRKLFTVCHEVGHFVLPGHGEAGCVQSSIESWRDWSISNEAAANRFASELLLPSRIVYPYVAKHKATIAAAKDLSASFGTSLTAAAYKLVEVTDEACALVWSTAGEIKWIRKNDNFFGYVAKGRVDDASAAASLMKADDTTSALDAEVFAQCWLSGEHLSAKDRVWEDSILLPTYNSVLTILTLE